MEKHLYKLVLEKLKYLYIYKHRFRDLPRRNHIQQNCIITYGIGRGMGHTIASLLLNKKLKNKRCITVFTSPTKNSDARMDCLYEKGSLKGVKSTWLSNIIDGMHIKDVQYDVIIFDCAGRKSSKDIIDLIIDSKIKLNSRGCIVMLQPKV